VVVVEEEEAVAISLGIRMGWMREGSSMKGREQKLEAVIYDEDVKIM